MEAAVKQIITVYTVINLPVEKVWKLWTSPEDIVNWNNASDDWHTTKAENNPAEGGRFSYRMEAKDGSMGFDFSGVYDKVTIYKQIKYTLDDGRKVSLGFTALDGKTKIVETFESEAHHPFEAQREGWQSILNNFKKYAESKKA
jgi:uncharacterized protein YndB with AHSA1/START domain